MGRGKKLIAYGGLGFLAAYSAHLLAYAVFAGQTTVRFGGWRDLDGPLDYLFAVLGNAVMLAVAILALYVLHYHERYFAAKAAEIWQSYRMLTGRK